MLKAYMQGVRKANTKQASKALKKAVEKLRSAMEKHATKVKENKYFKDVHKLMKSEIAGAVAKIKEKYKKRETKKGHDGALLVKRLTVDTYSSIVRPRLAKSAITRLKRDIAKATGWSPVTSL